MGQMAAFTDIKWALTGILGKMVLWLWAKSARITLTGDAEYATLRHEGKPVIFLVWHGRIFLAPYFFRKRGIMALVSPSQDGEIVVQIIRRWGYDVSRGSSSHSVKQAWLEMIKKLKDGGEVIIVPDGPRGPARRLKPGCLKLAQQTGAFLVPFTFSASKIKVFGSWDRFAVFHPFSKVRAVLGKPIAIDSCLRGEKLEKERRRIEGILMRLDDDAEAFFGREPLADRKGEGAG